MIKWLYKPVGNCPVQSEGIFLNHYFYFRARYSTVTIEFYPINQRMEEDKNLTVFTLYKTSDIYKAGWLPKWKCLLLIYWGCLRFLIKRHNSVIWKL